MLYPRFKGGKDLPISRDSRWVFAARLAPPYELNADMKYLDEYRDAAAARQLAAEIARTTTRPWSIMEVCGGQTHAILRFGSMNCCRRKST